MKNEYIVPTAVLAVAALIVAGVVYVTWQDVPGIELAKMRSKMASTTPVNASSTMSTGSTGGVGQGIAVGEPNPSAPGRSGFEARLSSLAAPSLTAPISFGSMLNAEQRTMMGEKIALQRAVIENGLATEAEHMNGWNNLALFYTFAKDFAKAEEVWLYLSKLFPASPVPLNYLGNMYRNDTRDFPKAEQAYRASLAISKAQPEVYAELYYLYSLQYRTDSPLAESTLLEALAQFPNDPAFTKALDEYRKSKATSTPAVGN